MTAGMKTSEFWLSLAAVLLGAFLAAGILPDTHWVAKVAGMVCAVLASMGYTISRGVAKIGQPAPQPAPKVDDEKPANPGPTV